MKLSRRKFIKATALTGAMMPLAGAVGGASEAEAGQPPAGETTAQADPGAGNEKLAAPQRRFKIYYFTKDLDRYETGFMAETLAMAGVDGLDLTVRRGGKVEPEQVTDELSRVIGIADGYNLPTHMIVTGILGTEEKETEVVLRTASALGVRHYRLGYYNYDLEAGILKSIGMIRERLRSLSAMNRKYNIQAGYQNHSGGRVGSPGWDVYELVKGFPVETISSQFDVRHATVEGNRSWIFVLHLLQRNIGSLAIKDFTWQVENGRARIVNVPLGEGLVDFNLYFRTLNQLNIDVPVTLHVEYPLLSPDEENLPLLEKQKIFVRKIKKDVTFIRDHETLT